MSEVTEHFTNAGVERTFSMVEAAALLGRSRSWLDQRLRAGQFTNVDGTPILPRRTAGGYRVFTSKMLQDIALSSYRHRWFGMDALEHVLIKLVTAAYRDTGEYKLPG